MCILGKKNKKKKQLFIYKNPTTTAPLLFSATNFLFFI